MYIFLKKMFGTKKRPNIDPMIYLDPKTKVGDPKGQG